MTYWLTHGKKSGIILNHLKSRHLFHGAKLQGLVKALELTLAFPWKVDGISSPFLHGTAQHAGKDWGGQLENHRVHLQLYQPMVPYGMNNPHVTSVWWIDPQWKVPHNMKHRMCWLNPHCLLVYGSPSFHSLFPALVTMFLWLSFYLLHALFNSHFFYCFRPKQHFFQQFPTSTSPSSTMIFKSVPALGRLGEGCSSAMPNEMGFYWDLFLYRKPMFFCSHIFSWSPRILKKACCRKPYIFPLIFRRKSRNRFPMRFCLPMFAMHSSLAMSFSSWCLWITWFLVVSVV